ncbi:isoprenylcysteine carboxylmethyltransferase family protein [Ruegeria sp. HKCCD6228]|jgi:protein-S-isoprenylcysteine O-methyltransferase Ste14|uniref:Isoprenylcysteine carboxylmethyltransferase family protein n=1 Tax=Ruegeria atlantica TaxID=81569 RepID=A0AA90YT13_9RHOB|nr:MULTISPECIES: isoprenylcysteine carboxylmethyltransferase family protein [Ruegeria]NOC91310.1 isoprenylcysteine carboxylmethyltransferase family protein [Ruegeria sp. HKCCD6604]NOD28839.1 isoprenylcysteine carboxylmethyltransferase family protein [Ruegeria atlantica]NOD98432.1 isoprenylcysteine carboxylmethyltransferase family protein [Ruegeria sp. HKCCD6228]NOE18302.1 isoprenylcysteine carboxylmethyltransferase family protein [Ruegeria atlantica]
MRWMDVPPVWLIAFAALAWLQARYLKLGLSLEGGLTDLLSGVLIGGGILMAVLAVVEFRRHKTTVIPHETPSSMVQSGIYKRSRNPIYVGDVLILAGLILRFDAVLSLVLVPVFVWVLERRFILPEEDRLRRTFRADFARYERKTRRWI